MLKSTCQQALQAIADKPKVLILIENSGDPLSLRARQVLYSNRIKLQKLGYTLLQVDSNDDTSKVLELACLKLPQVRIFKKKIMTQKHIGVPTESILREIFEEALCNTLATNTKI
jgi:hypothetical protein